VLGGPFGGEINMAGRQLGAIGAGGLERMAGTEQRHVGYATSVGRQAGLEQVERTRDMWRQMLDTRRQMAAEALSRASELRRERERMALARSSLGLERERLGLQYPQVPGPDMTPNNPGGGGGGNKPSKTWTEPDKRSWLQHGYGK
jgi:hypothetical protein